MLLWNIALALVWAAMAGELSLRNVVLGFAVGYLALSLSRRALGSSDYIVKVRKAASFLAFFLWDLVRANARLAAHVIAPVRGFRPGIVAYALEGETDGEITLFANAVTLSPGTLALHLSPDRRTLYLHTMYTDDVGGLRGEIKRDFERPLLELLR
ncbi:MAG: Na+/H+ antiporter subunit E [Polyangiaceae bacterium]|nr:Na+/H+ antiporter subunit E [Polyangiaceae bacterium]